MIYCTQCGKQNQAAAKFCTGCGTMLIASSGVPVLSTYPDNAPGSKKNKNTLWLTIGVVVFMLGAGAYFLFFNNKKKNTTLTVHTEPPADSAIAPRQNRQVTPVISEPAPLNPVIENTVVTISQAEIDNVSETLRAFYQCENNEDISCLLGHYSFPVNRYYQLNYASYEDLHKLFTESFTEKLVSHFITIKWNYCTVQKEGEGYKAVLYADYEFRRSKTPDELMSRSIQIILYMNNNYKISSIYENQ